MDKEQFYQMRLHRDTFESQKIERDTDFSFKVIDNNNPLHIRDNISDIKFICNSIKKELGDWEDKPSLDTALERLNSISSLFLFYHKDFNKAIGWGWFSDTFTYDWINNIHPLPTENSWYLGGTYIQKNLNLPPKSGFQLYYQAFSYLFSKKEWLYGYMDNWNKAPIMICHKLGGEQYNFIEDYGREY